MIGFETESDKVERMKEIIYRELEKSTKELFKESELAPVVTVIKRSNEQVNENLGIDFWMNVLNSYAEYGKDITDHSAFDKALDSITVKDIQRVAQKFLKHVKLRDWVIKSEKENPLSDWE